ncbi:MAG: hypothetical protein SGJ10_06185 [Bacteroidota bacterium]|nr:hypothetical protein [Bacteroidota bacterium]
MKIIQKYQILLVLCFAMVLANPIAAQQLDSMVLLKNCKQLVEGANGNYYSINANSDILKYDSSLKILVTQHFKSFGAASIIDASNPFDISVFYADDNIVLVTDNNLTFKFQIDLNTLGQNYSAFAKSYDNEFLLFDANLKKIIKFNGKGEIIKQTNNLEQTTGDKLQVKILYDNGQSILMFDEKNIIYNFDLNGRLLKKLNLKNNHFINFSKEGYYISDTNGVYQTTTQSLVNKTDTVFHFAHKLYKSKHMTIDQSKIINYKTHYLIAKKSLFLNIENDIVEVPFLLFSNLLLRK